MSSSFYFNKVFMIDKNVVKKLVEEWLQDKEYFLVSVEISPDNRIVVEIDHAECRTAGYPRQTRW